MKDPEACTSYTLTRVNWTDSVDGHPHTYYPSEVIYKLRQSNFTNSYMFARKFSPDCLQPLMNMATEVIFRSAINTCVQPKCFWKLFEVGMPKAQKVKISTNAQAGRRSRGGGGKRGQ